MTRDAWPHPRGTIACGARGAAVSRGPARPADRGAGLRTPQSVLGGLCHPRGPVPSTRGGLEGAPRRPPCGGGKRLCRTPPRAPHAGPVSPITSLKSRSHLYVAGRRENAAIPVGSRGSRQGVVRHKDVFRVTQGRLYPAPPRMPSKGWMSALSDSPDEEEGLGSDCCP